MKETSSKSNVYSSSSMGSNLLSTHLSESHNSPNDNINISEFNPNKEIDLNRTITDSDSESNEEKPILTDLDQSSTLNKSINTSNRKQNGSKNERGYEHGRWTPEEHDLFLEGLMLFGNEWKSVQEHIKTRSATQARSHAQKFFIKLRKVLSSEINQDLISEKIIELFQTHLGNKFNPNNIETFVKMMKKLIFTNEQAPEVNKVIIGSINNVKLIKPKTSNQVIIEKDIDEDNQSYYSALGDDNKQQIFSISKDCSRKTSINYPIKEINKKELNKQFSSLTKSFQNSNPSCINFVTINMVNNSQNNYVNTINEPQMQNKFCNTFNMKNETKDSNPFNIQFDDVLGGNNNGLNFFEDQYNNNTGNNNDLGSLLNMWNL